MAPEYGVANLSSFGAVVTTYYQLQKLHRWSLGKSRVVVGSDEDSGDGGFEVRVRRRRGDSGFDEDDGFEVRVRRRRDDDGSN
ncbi:hypothetical protein OsI_24873 [Oryza sativa Indica Group]|uniref:Uncharacterized protein n=1 Tax=Oryza sativa subsp. indica TaxID=39946 RepID=A2YI43_ORYSI|nr:hypothetical protein OsI_24873 [Oryza sativa Indica Group]